jgi:Acyclic terpene utilisation family protein AtuA
MKNVVKIASGQGFWGDLLTAPYDQVTRGPVDYLVMDYLAEVTMSIMQKQKRRDPKLGYARDLIPLMEKIFPVVAGKGIRVITNGGGVNPEACRDALLSLATRLGIRGLQIGIVQGDDLMPRLSELRAGGIELKNMETGQPLSEIESRIVSANVYFGAWPIVEALKQGADIVITGRTTDTGLTLAPMAYEFGWAADDWDRLAAGTVAGHVLECGGQASGGNFSADWRAVPDLAHIGFPIAEASPDGQVVITKHPGSGGLVSPQTVKEQLVYEIGDPRSYITPDCIADFTSICVESVASNRVKLSGIKGKPATDSYKVSMSYFDGYTAVGTLTYAWPDALEKARAADRILRARLDDLGLRFEEIRTEFVGHSSCHGPIAEPGDDLNEVVLRVGVRGADAAAVERFGMEIAPLILTGPPAVTGFAGGRPKPSEVISYWPALMPKTVVKPVVSVEAN